MSEVLEIQIQEKAPSGAPGQPRPPSAAAAAPARASLPRATTPAVPALPRGHSATKADSAEGIIDLVAEHLGFGRQVEALRQLYDYFTAKPPSAAPPPEPQALLALPATAPQPAAPAPAANMPIEPLPAILERGFGKLEDSLRGLGDYFAKLPQPAPAVTPAQSAATAPAAPKPTTASVQPPRSPAPPSPMPRPQPPAAVQAAAPPRAPQPPTAPRALTPSAAKEPIRPPRVPQTAPSPPAVPVAPPRPPAAPIGPAAQSIPVAGEASAAGAEAAGGTLASVAAAALPVAAAFVVAEAALKLTEAAFDGAREAVEGFGHQLSAVAGNDYLGMFEHGLESTEKTLSKIPIAGGLLSSAFGAAVAPVRAFTEVTEAFTKRAHELAGFSPSIAMSEARAGVRSIMDDFKEANDLGPDLARMLDAESKMQHELREIFLPIKKVAVTVVADILENVEELVSGINALLTDIKTWMEKNGQAAGAITGLLAGMVPGVDAAVSILGLMRAEDARKKTQTDPEFWLRDLYNAVAADVEEPPLPDANQQRPNFPVVNFPGL